MPPDILDAESSKDITVNEGQNCSLYCVASGNPHPRKFTSIVHHGRITGIKALTELSHLGITWRRDDGSAIVTKVGNKIQRSDMYEGELLSFENVGKKKMQLWGSQTFDDLIFLRSTALRRISLHCEKRCPASCEQKSFP